MNPEKLEKLRQATRAFIVNDMEGARGTYADRLLELIPQTAQTYLEVLDFHNLRPNDRETLIEKLGFDPAEATGDTGLLAGLPTRELSPEEQEAFDNMLPPDDDDESIPLRDVLQKANPQPWTAEADHNNTLLIYDANGVAIAQMATEDMEVILPGQDSFNAALLIQATTLLPELIESVQTLLNDVDAGNAETPENSRWPEFHALLKKAQAVKLP
jgi:hypothetical protein